MGTSGFSVLVFMAPACVCWAGQHIGKIPGASLIPAPGHQGYLRHVPRNGGDDPRPCAARRHCCLNEGDKGQSPVPRIRRGPGTRLGKDGVVMTHTQGAVVCGRAGVTMSGTAAGTQEAAVRAQRSLHDQPSPASDA